MFMDGIAMQRISLGALIIALGMLVDNAIVVTDGILVRLKKGEEVASAATAVVKATVWPLLGGTLVGILAFSAIGLSPSDMGEYAGSLFWVILYSMLLSWVFAITLTPLFCQAFLKVKANPAAAEPRLLVQYRALLQWTLLHRRKSALILFGLFAAGVVAFGFVPPGFMPDSARPQFVVDLYLPQGTAIEATTELVAEAEKVVQAKPGVRHVSSFVGQGGLRFMLTYSPEDPNPAYAQLLVDVEDFDQIAGLIGELQQELGDATLRLSSRCGSSCSGAVVARRSRPPSGALIRRNSVVWQKRPRRSWRKTLRHWRFRTTGGSKCRSWRRGFRPMLHSGPGVLPSDIAAALDRNFSGTQVGVYREHEKLIPIIARAPAGERQGVEDLHNVQVYSQTAGRYVPVEQFISDAGHALAERDHPPGKPLSDDQGAM
jgi:multidrug efflux pump subunit AcrB